MRFAPVMLLLMTISAADSASLPPEEQQALNRVLLEAIEKGDPSEVETALEKGADPNAEVPGSRPPLVEAIEKEEVAAINAKPPGSYRVRTDAIELLLDWGANPYLEGGDYWHEPVFFHAANKRCEPIAKLLISRGIDVNGRNSEGKTALSQRQNRPEDLRMLLDLGADPNVKDNSGTTPLMQVARQERIYGISDEDQKRARVQGREIEHAIRLLITHGADVNARDNEGNTALHYAVYRGPLATAKALVSAGIDMNVRNSDGDSALTTALENNEDHALYLIDHGADLSFAAPQGQTFLHIATQHVHLKSMAKLIDRGMSPNVQTTDGTTPLHMAARRSDSYPGRIDWREQPIQMVELLLRKGADLAIADQGGETPLHAAAKDGYAGTVGLLVEKGADPNAVTKTGLTPLMMAIESELDPDEKVQALVAKGALVEPKEPTGITPMMMAARLVRPKGVVVLLAKGGRLDRRDDAGNSILGMAASSWGNRTIKRSDYATVLQAITERCQMVDEPDANGVTPLMWASAANVPQAVQSLLQRKANVNARSKDGRTPLMWAAAASALDVIPILVAAGADATAQDSAGRTPLDWAKWMNQSEAAKLAVLQATKP